MDIVESLRRAAAGASHTDPLRGVLFTCGEAADEIERLRAALTPFALDVTAKSLAGALGHITREDLLRARAALDT